MCGESHWKAAENTGKKRAKLDETGLEIAGCRHGLAQWAVDIVPRRNLWLCPFSSCKENVACRCTFFLGGHCMQILEMGI